MPEDYQNVVLTTYIKMRDEGELHVILPRETTAQLKKASLKVYDSRYTPADADILSSFFKKDKMNCDFREVISGADPDYFKALWKHIRGMTEKTNEENSDFLAWLIDFKPRPRMRYYKNLRESIQQEREPISEIPDEDNSSKQNNLEITADNEKPEVVALPTINDKIEKQNESLETEANNIPHAKDKKPEIKSIIGNNIDPTIHSTRWQIHKKFHKTVYAFTAAAFVLASTYVIVKSTKKQCMYWNGHQYEAVACDEKKGDFSIIAFNEPKKDRLKRILQPDTLTINSVRKVWYNKVWADSLDFYTDSGAVPTDSRKRLMPMTRYMLNKYIIQKKLAKQQ